MKTWYHIFFLLGILLIYNGYLHAIPLDSEYYLTDDLLTGSINIKLENLNDLSWSGTEVISTISTEHSQPPSMAIDNELNIHVVWHDYTDFNGAGTDSDIFYRRWDATTKSWTTITVISSSSSSSSHSAEVAVDLDGNVYVVWRDSTDYSDAGTDYDIFYRRWNSDSDVWSSVQILSDISTNDSNSPGIITDTSGNVHVVWYDKTDYSGSGADYDIFYRKWNSATNIWGSVEVISTESSANSWVPDLTTDDSGNVHVVWYDETDYSGSGADFDIFYKQWVDETNVWTVSEVLSTESSNESLSSRIVSDKDGSLHVVWYDDSDYDGSGTDQDIFYKSKPEDTGTWTTTEVVSTESDDTSTHPEIATDLWNNIYVIWKDSTNYNLAGTDDDIFYKVKNATLDSWTTTEVVSEESSENSAYPFITVNNLGHIHAVWRDETDYNGAGTDADIFYKKYAGVPSTPQLDSISPNPNTNGLINLGWNDAIGAAKYYVYRDNESINLVNSELIATTTSSQYSENVTASDTYYYAVVANNIEGNSSLSNEVSVEVTLPGGPPDFFGDLPLPSADQLVPIFFAGMVLEFFVILILLRRRK